MNRSIHRLLYQALAFSAFAALIAGCGPSVATVKGTVTYKGEKVKGGTIFFAPVGGSVGPPAASMVGEDGTFALKSEAGGAVVGKNTVTYSAPGGTASKEPGVEGTPSPYTNLTPAQPSVEVKSGINDFTIELK